MKKRVLSMLLAFTLCFSTVPMTAFAQGTEVVAEQEEQQEETEPAAVQEEVEAVATPETPVDESTTAEDSVTDEEIDIVSPADESVSGGDAGEQNTEVDSENDAAVQAVQALIDALPDEVTAENADELQTQQAAIDEAMAALTEEQIAALDMERYDAICAALTKLVAVQDGEHIHPICGATCNDGEKHTNVTWTPTKVLTDDMEAGNYYLTTNITLEHQWAPTNNINLCLNGHNITFTKNDSEATDQNVIVIKNVRLNLCDAHGQGAVIAAVNESTGTLCGGVYIENGVFNLYNDAKINAHDYGVWINQNGSFTMYGGTVTGKAREGVHVSQAAEFDMKGGEISGCETNGGVLVMGRSTSDSYSRVGGKFNMTGGKICNNTSTDAENGGGVTVYYGQYGYGSFTMEGGEISGNTAKNGNGGGVYIKCNASNPSYYPGGFTMTGGTISGNTASGKGGGVYVEANKSSMKNIAMFYFGRDAKITDNTVSNVYLCDNNTITISWYKLKSGAHIGVTLENLPEEGAYTVIATSANNGYLEDAITSDNADYTILRSGDEVIIYSKTTKLHSVSYTNNINAGTATVTITDVAGGNYNVSGSTTFNIGKATITVTPKVDQKTIYGMADPELKYSSAGAENSEVPAFTGALSRADGTNAGKYDITLGTLALADNSADNFMAANYELKLADTAVQFEIVPKTLDKTDLEFTDSTITKTYDGTTECTTATVRIKQSAIVYKNDDLPTVKGTYAYNSANVKEATEVTFTSDEASNNNYMLFRRYFLLRLCN